VERRTIIPLEGSKRGYTVEKIAETSFCGGTKRATIGEREKRERSCGFCRGEEKQQREESPRNQLIFTAGLSFTAPAVGAVEVCYQNSVDSKKRGCQCMPDKEKRVLMESLKPDRRKTCGRTYRTSDAKAPEEGSIPGTMHNATPGEKKRKHGRPSQEDSAIL